MHQPPDRLRHHGDGSAYEEEHKQLMARLDALTGATSATQADEVLKELHGSLERHFGEEENADGVFRWLAAIDPSLGPTLTGLESDHKELLAELAGLGGKADGAEFHDATVAFVDHLKAHEKTERAALRQAMDD